MRVTRSSAILAFLVFWATLGVGCTDKLKAPVVPGAVPGTQTPAQQAEPDEDQDPPEVALGQRLFRETRFNQFFYVRSQGNANAQLIAGDPVLEFLPTLTQPFKNPYAGQGMNCASCHFVNELQEKAGLGNRAYNDFARRSPIPDRLDGRTTTLRNSPPFVNSTLALEADFQQHALFLHGDGEFASPEELVIGGFTGRNFGWLPTESATAVAHLVKVVREDDGNGQLAQDYGGSYRTVLTGQDARVPAKFKLPADDRVDVASATDEQILGTVSKLVGAYLRSLIYRRDEMTSEFNGSPYDVFLAKNKLPRKPEAGETELDYARRLRGLIEGLPEAATQFVADGVDGKFKLSQQPFAFGNKELSGLKLFLGKAGNCIACHAPPAFTDFSFHNTGAAQEEYDSVHGRSAFASIPVPTFAERILRQDEFFGPSPAHPQAQGRFASVPSKDRPGFTDLGVWNVFGNPSIPSPQSKVRKALCDRLAVARPGVDCSDESALSMAFAAFKTPTLRNLGQSAPYLHTGRKNRLEDVMSFYLEFSALARLGRVRSGDTEMARIGIQAQDVPPVVAFLQALNEDYH